MDLLFGLISVGINFEDILIKNKVRYKVKPMGTNTTIPAIKAFLSFEVIDDFFFINYMKSRLQNIKLLRIKKLIFCCLNS